MKILTILCLLFFTSTTDFELIKTIETRAPSFTVDALDNIYLIDSYIEKLDNKSGTKSTYQPMVFGNLSSVDVSNPMKVLVYYRELQTIVWLDNFMNPHSDPIELNIKLSGNITQAAYSKNNRLWLYNQSKQQLMRYDLEFNEVSKSLPINTFVSGEIEPEMIIEYQDNVYLFDKENRVILAFDIFGNFIRKITTPSGILSISGNNNEIVATNGTDFFIYDTKIFQESILKAPKTGFQSGIIRGDKIYIKDKNRLEIYTPSKK